jgi:hypothetical protein
MSFTVLTQYPGKDFLNHLFVLLALDQTVSKNEESSFFVLILYTTV